MEKGYFSGETEGSTRGYGHKGDNMGEGSF